MSEAWTNQAQQEKQAQLDAERLANDIRLEEENKKLVELQSENEKKKSDREINSLPVNSTTFRKLIAE